jgi:lipopolysaccharide/colanic/teichoic acid biosynthesis glycosyltransferase
MSNFYSNVKRVFDVVISACVLFITSPVLIITSILIYIEDKGPVLYKQDRLGFEGKVFKMIKFRSMTDKDRDMSVQIFDSDTGLTTIGGVIRRLKIDELPQFYHVLLGEMSIVGPRPCLPPLKESFDYNGKKRIKVKPGITGLAQVNGNTHLDWKGRWKLDAYYVDNCSIFLDFKIILKTIFIVIFGEKIGKKI